MRTVNIVSALQFSLKSGKNILHTDNYKRFRWQIELNSREKKGKAQESDSWPSKMGAIGCPETSVRNHHYPLCNGSEERKCHAHRGGNLKSRKCEFVCKNALKAYAERSTTPLILHLGTR